MGGAIGQNLMLKWSNIARRKSVNRLVQKVSQMLYRPVSLPTGFDFHKYRKLIQ